MIIEIIGIFFLLLLSAFFSSSETAITRISDVKSINGEKIKIENILKLKS